MAKAGATTKDIAIRFTGENLLGQTAQQVQRELDGIVKKYRRTNDDVARAAIAARGDRHFKTRFDEIRASEEKALKLRQFYARKQAELDQVAVGRRFSGGAFKKAFGAAGLAAGMIGDSFGNESPYGRAASAIGSVGGAAAMGGMVAGPWGAAIFGGVEALRQFKGALDDAAKSLKEVQNWGRRQVVDAVKRRGEAMSDLKQMRLGQFPELTTETDIRNTMRESLVAQHRMVMAAKAGRGGFKPSQAAALDSQLSQGLLEVLKFDQSRGFRDSGAQGLQALWQSRGNLGAGAMQIGRDLLGQGRAGLLGVRDQFAQANMARAQPLIEMGRSSADQMRIQMQEMFQAHAGGAIDESAYRRARRQLFISGVGQLPDRVDMPGLAATTGRLITRGPEQKTADELSAIRKEAKEHARANERALAALLTELQGEGAQE